jgi:hypothetical protein
VVVAEAVLPTEEEPSVPLTAAAAPLPDTMDAAGEEQADLAIATETVVVVEDATSAASDASDLVGASTGEEATAAEPSSEPGAEDRQARPQEA